MNTTSTLFFHPPPFLQGAAPPAKLKQRPRLIIQSALVGVVLYIVNVAKADAPGAAHYPDLQPYPAYSLRVDSSTGRHKLLDFSAAIGNFGDGPMELFPQNNPATGTTDAYQRLYTHDASGQWYAESTRYVGTFAFHPEHDHWHFENFASYELRNTAPDGSIGATVLASSRKVSFCLLDSWLGDGSLEHASSQTYVTCGQNGVQGISVGWADVYPWYLPGQNLDITGLHDGSYWLLITVDPAGVLAEGGAAKANNVSATKFRLNKGKRIQILQ
jgi:hypothetical protein